MEKDVRKLYVAKQLITNPLSWERASKSHHTDKQF